MDFNFLNLAPESPTSLRQAKSGISSEAEIQPELFDFAGILGSFINSAADASLAIPDLTEEHASTEAMAAQSLLSNGGDKAEFIKLPDFDPLRLTSTAGVDFKALDPLEVPPTAGSDFKASDPLRLPPTAGADFKALDPLRLPSTAGADFKALEHPRLSDQRFSTTLSAPLRVGAPDPAISDQPVAIDQSGIAKGYNHRSDPMTTPHLSNSANPISSSGEVATGGLSNSTQRLNHETRKKTEGDALVRRMNVATGLALQAQTVPDSELPSAAISLATPMLPSPMSAQSGRISRSDFRFTVSTDAGSPTMSHDPAPILGVGELLGVAGKLQFTKESPSTSLIHGLDSVPAITQGGQSPILPHHGPSPSQQQLISTPLSSLQWPTVFSSSIVRLATEQITQANLTVTPDDLGTISITIALDGSKVSLGFNAENSEVRQAVNASLPLLQEMLEKSGLSLGQSSVGREAPRDANPNNFGQTKDSHRESESVQVVPAKPAQILIPASRAGRVDFFA
ncbi:MAG: flagellar hook-length control protein FliK [Rhodocyclaceae bacterium]|nr:flagellar hook-length control protein FliK [Rhodocyclaceae bacterium]